MTHDAAGLFAEAQAKYQKGDLADAADAFQKILERDPRQPDALHMLGVIAYQLGQVDAAEALLRQAVSALYWKSQVSATSSPNPWEAPTS